MTLRTKLLAPFLVLVCCTTAFVFFFWLPDYVAHEKEGQKKEAAHYLSLLAEALTPDLLGGDLAKIHLTLDNVLKSRPEWRTLLLTAPDGMVLYPIGGEGVPKAGKWTWIGRELSHLEVSLGKIEVGFNLEELIGPDIKYIRTLILLLLVELFAISLISVLFLELKIGLPLARLAGAVDRIAGGDYEFTMPRLSGDEMARFTRAFEGMRRAVRERQEALKESEQRLGAIIQNSAEGILTVSEQMVVRSVNASAERIFGYGEGEMTDGNLASLIPGAVEFFFDSAKGSARTAREGGGESRGRRKDGTSFLIWLAVGEVKLEKERLFVCTVLDITEQKEAEEELRKHFRAGEDSPVGIVIADTGSMVEYVNPAFEAMSGHSKDELIGTNIRLLQSGLTPDGQYRSLFRSLRAGSTYKGEFLNRKKDGTRYWARNSISPVRNDWGKIVHYVCITEDITEEKKTEEELRSHRDNLQALVEAQTLDLKIAKEAAEAANRSKSVFLANMSHEIRTPMNAVIGMTELVLETELGEYQKNLLSTVYRSANTLLSLLNDILDLSKLEEGKMEMEEIDFDVNRVLEDAVEMLAPQAASKGISLVYEAEPAMAACVKGDPGRLRQVIVNLVGNAVKFTEQGGVSVRVAAASRGMYRFEVEDTGIGITRERIDAVFDVFTQADSSTSRQYGGTGLGTTLCKLIVESMGGEIGVESRVGEGSRFHFTLPLPPSHMERCDYPPASATPGVMPGLSRRFHILLAEDVEENITLGVIRLEQAGQRVTVARNGMEAVAFHEKAAPDLILMDIQMPEMDGFAATEAIREKEAGTGRHVPIIAMTASVMKSDRERCFAAGMDDFVGKPVDFARLFECVERSVDPGAGEPLPERAGQPHGRVEEGLPPLREIDTRKGLRTWQSVEAYLGALRGFNRRHGGDGQKIREAVSRGDLEAARGITHALKGVSANLAVRALPEAAAELGTALRKGMSDSCEEMIGRVSDLLAATVKAAASLEPIVNKREIAEPEPSGGDGPRKMMAELLEALRQTDPDVAEPLIERLTAMGVLGMEEVAQLVSEFEFDLAEKTMSEIMKNTN